jgi:ribosome-interacting GTPase 1
MVNANDDILVMGKTEEESNQNVDRVLKRLEEHGLILNEAKCQFDQSEITFFGLHFTEKGVSLNETKIKAFNEFKISNNASELHMKVQCFKILTS